MASSIQTFYEQAQLSNAAYTALMEGMSIVDYRASLQEGGFTATEAAEFATKYAILDVYEDPATSFYAVLFQKTGSNGLREKTLAIRGTLEFHDLVITDLQLGLFGITAQNGSLKSFYPEILARLAPTDSLTVTGHSLGGFLAQVFSADFTFPISHVYTYNAPGIGSGFSNLFGLFGLSRAIPNELITNLVGQGQTFVSSTGQQLGAKEDIFIEGSLNPLTNHSVATLEDALILYDLFATIDPNLNQDPSTITSILRAMSMVPSDSLERALDALGELFNGPGAILTPIDQPAAYYDDITELKMNPLINGSTRVFSLANLSESSIAGLAKQDISYRYALRELNPFSVIGADYAIHNTHAALDLYDVQTGHGTMTALYLSDRAELLAKRLVLNLNDGGTVPTDTYYVDVRTELELGSVASTNKVIFGDAQDNTDLTGHAGGDHLYGGEGNDLLMGQRGTDYLEGNQGNDELYGGGGNDILLGQQGDDRLYGEADNDRLNGGLGDDRLDGGTGLDTYSYHTGQGQDRIADADKVGTILFDNQALGGGIRQQGDPADTYRSADGRFTYMKSGANLVINNALTIENFDFATGALGIRLFGEADYAPVTRSEFLKIDRYEQWAICRTARRSSSRSMCRFSTTRPTIRETRIPIGGLVPEIGDEHNLIHGGGGNDRVVTGAGDDEVYGEDGDDTLMGRGGSDRLSGGLGNDTMTGDGGVTTVTGNDSLDGGAGDDLLLGFGGSDFLFGGSGNDYLEGDNLESLALGIFGHDFLDGGEGGDELHGVGGADLLLGGAGDDFLLGDAVAVQGGTPGAGDADSLDGGSGNDYLDGQYGNDVLQGGLDHDTLSGGDNSDILYGDDGNDDLSGDLRRSRVHGLYAMLEYRGAGGNDLLDGGNGIDVLSGGEGDDVLDGGSGDDTLYGDYNPNLFPVFTYVDVTGANDTVNGTAIVWGNDLLDGGDGDDMLRGGDGHDVLIGGNGDDALFGGDGDDEVGGGDGADTLDGGPGIDIVRAGAGDDRLIAGAEDETLYGEDGNDTLISGNESRSTGNSVLVGGSGNDAYVVDSAADTVVEDQNRGLDSVQSFVSYTLPDHVENLSLSGDGLTATGNELDNVLRGTRDSVLDGRGGNDTLIDGQQYLFSVGYGHDKVSENDISSAPYFPGGATDAIQFGAEVSPDQIQWQRSGNDLVLSLDGTSHALTIPSFYALAFNQGTYLFSSNIFLPGPTVAAGGNPYYVAPSQVERFEFADGTVWGVDAFDATTIGAYHANTYSFGRGDGQDTILDFDFTGEQPADILQMKVGVAPNDVILGRVGDDLLVRFEGATDRLTVQSHFASVFVRFLSFSGQFLNAYRIEQIQFADGTMWDAAAIANQLTDLTGTASAEFLRGNARPNIIQGLGGNDTYRALEA